MPDDGVNAVISLMGTIVGSEGGTLELIEASGSKLRVRYKKGTNEKCQECVPSHEIVQQMMVASLKMHAPNISVLELI